MSSRWESSITNHYTHEQETLGGAIVAVLLFALSTKTYAQSVNVSVVNQDTEAISLTLNAPDGGHPLVVGANSSQQETLPGILSVTINGQTLVEWQNGTVTLPDNTQVSITWQQGSQTASVVIVVQGTGETISE